MILPAKYNQALVLLDDFNIDLSNKNQSSSQNLKIHKLKNLLY